jgi:hypothetical protein
MPPAPSAGNQNGAGRLLVACAVIAVLWLVVLPAVGRIPAVEAYVARNEAAGIDPSVKFYSEVTCMSLVIERVDSAHRTSGAVFWNPRASEGRGFTAETRRTRSSEKKIEESEK